VICSTGRRITAPLQRPVGADAKTSLRMVAIASTLFAPLSKLSFNEQNALWEEAKKKVEG